MLDPVPTARSGAPTNGARRILLVEDEPTVRELTGEMLERHGYEVLEAEEPDDALELAGGQSFDLVLTDVVMPKMNGCELVRRIRERIPTLTVVYMSGYAPEHVLDGLGPGEHFLQKPFTMSLLAQTVGAALDGRPAP